MWAHSVNGHGHRHSLSDHLRGTARLAGMFAGPFGLGDLAAWAGLVHDGGKAWCEWQAGLLRAEAAGGRVGLDHKSYGVALASDHGLRPVAWAVAGHHGGLTAKAVVQGLLGASEEAERELRSGRWADAEARLHALVPEIFTSVPELPDPFRGLDRSMSEMAVRFLFSALVDADVLDTRAHRLGDSVPSVGPDLDAEPALERFLGRRKNFLARREAAPMDGLRDQLFEAALAAADNAPGVYRMTAPTGSAKTIASAAFALAHAARHRLRRVIVAVPFITITEQNAGVYRDLLDPLGDDAPRMVLEHHSGIDLDRDDADHRRWHRLAAENWDAPFVVTTTVQLWESLFGRKPAQMRKVHRLAGSVLVLDEVQALPHRLLPQIADALRVLTCRFGVTVLLSSATQPQWEGLGPLRQLPIRDVVPDVGQMFADAGRVRYRWMVDPRPSMADVINDATRHRQALMVVNTVGDARTAYRSALAALPEEVTVRHLSTGMCPAHRRAVLCEVRELLAQERPVFVVSTSLIEAGVDVDFPVVYRAVSPPESMAQAAGRCNREGRLGPEGGLVVLFDPADGGAPPSYATQISKSREHFGPERADPENPLALQDYFADLYSTLDIEGSRGVSATIAQNRERWDFLAVADGPYVSSASTERDRRKAFRLILDDTVPVVVAYGFAEQRSQVAGWLTSLRGGEPDRDVLRQLQPYITTVRRATTSRPDVAALLYPVVGDLVEWRGEYDDGYGIVLEPQGEDYIC